MGRDFSLHPAPSLGPGLQGPTRSWVPRRLLAREGSVSAGVPLLVAF